MYKCEPCGYVSDEEISICPKCGLTDKNIKGWIVALCTCNGKIKNE